jgi:uncharacterized membrane protein
MAKPGNVTVTTEVGFCPFCGRTRNLRREERRLGALVRTILECESCHRTLSSTMGPMPEPQAEAEAPPQPEPAATEPEPQTTAGKPAAKKKPTPDKKAAAARKPSAARKPAAATRKTATKKAATKKKA